MNMETVQNVITNILPQTSVEKLQAVTDHLKKLGFENMADLEFLDCEKDLANILNTCETRKLAAKLKLHFSNANG